MGCAGVISVSFADEPSVRRLMQRLQSNLAYLTAMAEVNQKKDVVRPFPRRSHRSCSTDVPSQTRPSPPPPILEAPSTPVLGPRLAASYATLKGYFVAAEKYEMQHKRGLTIVPTTAPEASGIEATAKVGDPKPLPSALGLTSTPATSSNDMNGTTGKRLREDGVAGVGPDGGEGPDAKKGKLDLATVPEEEVVPANPPPSNALAPPANLVVNPHPAATGFSTAPSDNAARFNAPPPDTAFPVAAPFSTAAASPAHNSGVLPPSAPPVAVAPTPQTRRSATPSQPLATPQQPPPRPTSAQPGQMYGSAIPPHLQQQQAQQLQQSPTPNSYAALSQQQQGLMRSQQAQAPDRPPSAAANAARPGSATQGQQYMPQPQPAAAPQQQVQPPPPPPRTPVQQPQQVPPSAPSAAGGGGDERPIAEQYSSVQAIISAPTFRQLPPVLQQQMQTQAQNLLYQMQAQAVAAARGGSSVNQAQQQQRMTTPAPTGPSATPRSAHTRVPSYSQSPHIAHAQVRQSSVGAPGTQYASSYAGSMGGSPPVMQQLPPHQQARPTSATSAGETSSAAFFREQLAAQQQALRSSTPAQYAPSPQQQHMYAAPSPYAQSNGPPSTPANYAAFGAQQRASSGPYQQQGNPYYQQAASPAQYAAASPVQAPSPAGYPVPQPSPYQQAGSSAPRSFSNGSAAAAPSPRAPSRGPGTPGPGQQQRPPQPQQYVPVPSQQQYAQQNFVNLYLSRPYPQRR